MTALDRRAGWLWLGLASSTFVALHCTAAPKRPHVAASAPAVASASASGSGSLEGTPLPVTVVASNVDARQLVADGDDLFWADSGTGTLVSMHWPTKATRLLAWSQTGVQRIAVDAQRVYWTKGEGLGGGGVYSVARSGGGKVDMLMGFGPVKVGGPKGLAVTNDGVYLAWSVANGDVSRVRKDGQPDAVFASSQAMPTDLAVDSGNVYWTVLGSGTSNGVVMRRPLASGELSTVAHHQEQPAWLIADGAGAVFWVVGGTGGSPGAVLRSSDGGPKVLAPVRGGSGLATDSTWVYFASQEDGLVQKVRKDGTERTLLARDQAAPRGLAVISDAVLWVNRGDRTIVSVPR